MKCKEELARNSRGRVVIDKMVKCYECEGSGQVLGSTPEYLGFTGIVFWTGPVLCKACQGWGQVPLLAQEQLATISA